MADDLNEPIPYYVHTTTSPLHVVIADGRLTFYPLHSAQFFGVNESKILH